MAVQGYLHHDCLAKAERLGIQIDGVALDDARVLHALHARPARGAAQSYDLADLLQAGAAIALKFRKDFSVYFVHAEILSVIWPKKHYTPIEKHL